MPIPVACQCGKQVNAPDNLAGKRVKCPGCGNPLDIPAIAAAPQADDGLGGLLSEAGMSEAPRCPECSEDLKPGAVLCVACGYNLTTGKKLKGVTSKSGGHSGVAEELLQKAEEAIGDAPAQHEGAYGKKAQEWVLFAVMGGIVAAVVAGAFAFFQYQEKKYEKEAQENAPKTGMLWHDDGHALLCSSQLLKAEGKPLGSPMVGESDSNLYRA